MHRCDPSNLPVSGNVSVNNDRLKMSYRDTAMTGNAALIRSLLNSLIKFDEIALFSCQGKIYQSLLEKV